MRMMAMAVVAMLAVPAAAQRTADYELEYSYPAQAARIAPLKAWLEADKARLRATVAREAAEARRAAKADGFPFRRHEAIRAWEVVADTPRFLSLSLARYRDTGGAHGLGTTGGMLWDKRDARRIGPRAAFLSEAALQAAVMPAWCRWMRAERVRRSGSDANNGTTFGRCPPVRDVTVLLGSSNGRAIDRIGIIADQYVVGPYVEGPYEHTLPVTPAILRAVKPGYRAAFAVR